MGNFISFFRVVNKISKQFMSPQANLPDQPEPFTTWTSRAIDSELPFTPRAFLPIHRRVLLLL